MDEWVAGTINADENDTKTLPFIGDPSRYYHQKKNECLC